MKLLNSMQPHTVLLIPLLSSGAMGDNWGDSFEIKGYMEEEMQLVRDQEGDEVTANSVFYTSEELDIKKGSKLEWDDEYYVMKVERKYNALSGQLAYTALYLR